jgi:hypothetical protein
VLQDREVQQLVGETAIHVSAVSGEGLGDLRQALALRLFGEAPQDYAGPFVFTRRQLAFLNQVRQLLGGNGPACYADARKVLEVLLG